MNSRKLCEEKACDIVSCANTNYYKEINKYSVIILKIVIYRFIQNSESYQTSMMERFKKIVNEIQPLNILGNRGSVRPSRSISQNIFSPTP